MVVLYGVKTSRTGDDAEKHLNLTAIHTYGNWLTTYGQERVSFPNWEISSASEVGLGRGIHTND